MNEGLPPPPGLIRITEADLSSPEVDDRLKRQMSLRGETGITRDRRRHWYYQNWFVFMIAGALGAAVAWAILEPHYDDLLYAQGPIQALDVKPLFEFPTGERPPDLDFTPAASVKINGDLIYLMDKTKVIRPDGAIQPLDVTALKQGDEIGVHLEYFDDGEKGVGFGAFVAIQPPAPSRTTTGLQQLSAQDAAVGLIVFPTVAAFIGLAIAAAEGIVCRVLRRALLAGLTGLILGFIGGFLSSILAGLAYAPLTALAMRQEGDSFGGLSTVGFATQMGGRGLAWALAGIAMGLGQGVALRSPRLALYGLLGGIIGGLLGGLLFDPIDFLGGGGDSPSSHWSRLVGFTVIGAGVGAMIGVVELLARDAWLRMTQGPLAGKEFLIFKDRMLVGSSPRSDIYLFNDPIVAGRHAVIQAVGDNYEIESLSAQQPVHTNGRSVTRCRLRHGDQIAIGRTTFVFQKRRG